MSVIFSILTIYFCYVAYMKQMISKRVFTIIAIIEGAVAAWTMLFK